MKKIQNAIKGLCYFVLGHFFAFFFYDTKYLRGRWFSGRAHGLCSTGWKWVTHDALSRIFLLDNKDSRFPIAHGCRVVHPENIVFNPNDLNNFQSFGINYQAIGGITIGEGTYIGPNVGLITANHDPMNLDKHLDPKPIILGENCWIGMNSVILPGVILGHNTVVGAGSIVTKSFQEGNCIIAGNPAILLRRLDSKEGA